MVRIQLTQKQTKAEDRRQKEMEIFVQEQVESHADSISVAVLQGDEIVYSYTYGEANPVNGILADTGTICRFGSITKPVTATALMQLVEQGRVNISPNPRNARTSLCASCWITPPA